jgi:ribosome-binding factor A
MRHDYKRTDRVADQIQRELAILIQQEVKDPRVGMVTITAVKVSKEFENALVYFTVMGDDAAVASTTEGLTKAAGFIRSELAHRLKLRTTPQLQFVYDTSIDDGARLSALINKAIKSDH